MTYYRIAIRRDPSLPWLWASMPLGSLTAAFHWFWLYQELPKERLRVFAQENYEEMERQFAQENAGVGSGSVPAIQFLQEQRVPFEAEAQKHSPQERRVPITHAPTASSNERVLDTKRTSALEHRTAEQDRGADYDLPYSFIPPHGFREGLAWAALLTKVHTGMLHP